MPAAVDLDEEDQHEHSDTSADDGPQPTTRAAWQGGCSYLELQTGGHTNLLASRHMQRLVEGPRFPPVLPGEGYQGSREAFPPMEHVLQLCGGKVLIYCRPDLRRQGAGYWVLRYQVATESDDRSEPLWKHQVLGATSRQEALLLRQDLLRHRPPPYTQHHRIERAPVLQWCSVRIQCDHHLALNDSYFAPDRPEAIDPFDEDRPGIFFSTRDEAIRWAVGQQQRARQWDNSRWLVFRTQLPADGPYGSDPFTRALYTQQSLCNERDELLLEKEHRKIHLQDATNARNMGIALARQSAPDVPSSHAAKNEVFKKVLQKIKNCMLQHLFTAAAAAAERHLWPCPPSYRYILRSRQQAACQVCQGVNPYLDGHARPSRGSTWWECRCIEAAPQGSLRTHETLAQMPPHLHHEPYAQSGDNVSYAPMGHRSETILCGALLRPPEPDGPGTGDEYAEPQTLREMLRLPLPQPPCLRPTWV